MAVTTARRRYSIGKILVGALLLIPAIMAVIWDEVLLAGPIVILLEGCQYVLGDIPGWVAAYLIFCPIWALVGLAFLGFMLRNVKEKDQTEKPEPKNWRERLVLKVAKAGKLFGVLTAMVVLGPVFGWPAFKMLGYTKKEVSRLTFLAAWIFGAIWLPFYGGLWSFGSQGLI